MLLLALLRVLLVSRTRLALENVALRQQLIVLRRGRPRPPLRNRDRLFWVLLRRLWPDWRSSLLRRENRTLQMERDFLKKAAAFFAKDEERRTR